jgi:hypothetical protein
LLFQHQLEELEVDLAQRLGLELAKELLAELDLLLLVEQEPEVEARVLTSPLTLVALVQELILEAQVEVVGA